MNEDCFVPDEVLFRRKVSQLLYGLRLIGFTGHGSSTGTLFAEVERQLQENGFHQVVPPNEIEALAAAAPERIWTLELNVTLTTGAGRVEVAKEMAMLANRLGVNVRTEHNGKNLLSRPGDHPELPLQRAGLNPHTGEASS